MLLVGPVKIQLHAQVGQSIMSFPKNIVAVLFKNTYLTSSGQHSDNKFFAFSCNTKIATFSFALKCGTFVQVGFNNLSK